MNTSIVVTIQNTTGDWIVDVAVKVDDKCAKQSWICDRGALGEQVKAAFQAAPKIAMNLMEEIKDGKHQVLWDSAPNEVKQP